MSSKGFAVDTGMTFQVSPAPWGYVLKSAVAGGMLRADWAVRLLRGLAVAVVLGLWIGPVQAVGPVAVTMKAGLSLFLVVFAFLPRDTLAPGRREVQVDLERRELRVGHRDAAGRLALEGVHDFGAFDAALLWRDPQAPGQGALILRLAGQGTGLVAGMGPYDDVAPWHARLVRDLEVAPGADMRADVQEGAGRRRARGRRARPFGTAAGAAAGAAA